MPSVYYNGVLIAQSNNCEKVEGNWYFPADSITDSPDIQLVKATRTGRCGWKQGSYYYYNLIVNGETVSDACWVYPEVGDAAKHFEGYFAWTRGAVDIVD
eukprot:TRINITY_DN7579_c0_g1_i1.p1 TRINITY_DN7579_c0_g1~~TRINITY_DN7579_c0_g1_i1.p1  ORF type:complete len:115 (+),score=25.91 TRINITY_DN7579_c0_g1_i1:48-347(+)